MRVEQPQAIHGAVEAAFNAGDVDALVALYEPDARMVQPDGTVAVGRDAIREVWQGFVALGGQMTLRTRFAVEMGDVALLRNDWTFEADGLNMASQTAEVVRRQEDGTWRYIVDHPFGSSDEVP